MPRILAELFPWLVALHVLDGLAWVRGEQWLLVSSWGRRMRLREAGLRLAGLGPAAEAVSTGRTPIALTDAGVYRPPRGSRLDAAEAELVPWAALGRLEVEQATVRAGGRRLAVAPTPAVAHATARLVRELCPLAPAARRAHLARAAEDAADVQAVGAVRERHLALARPLRVLAAALFGLLFVALPLALFAPAPWRPRLDLVLAAVAVTYAATVAASVLTLRRCGRTAGAIAGTLAPLVLFPPAAIHALTLVGRDLYAPFHPLAVAAALLDRPAFAALARREYHRMAGARARATGTPLADWWTSEETIWRAVVAAVGLAPDDVLAPPPRADAAAATYCPACAAEYRDGFALCGDCGVPLEAFETG